jgi:hypothetical protein
MYIYIYTEAGNTLEECTLVSTQVKMEPRLTGVVSWSTTLSKNNHAPTGIYICVCTYIYMYIHRYIHMSIYIYAYIYMSMLDWCRFMVHNVE